MGTYNPIKDGWCIPLPRHVVLSLAFSDLSDPAVRLLVLFYNRLNFTKQRRKRGAERYTPQNNGTIYFSYKAAKNYGFSPQRFNRYRNELVEKGFIDIVHRGSGTNKSANVYALSDRWMEYGQPSFKKAEVVKDDRGQGVAREWANNPEKMAAAIKRGNPKARAWKTR